MAAVANIFVDIIRDAWQEVVAPVDGSGLAYRYVDTIAEQQHDGQHREFAQPSPFDFAEITEIAGLMNFWSMPIDIFFFRRGRTHDAFWRSVRDEVVELERAALNAARRDGVREIFLSRVEFVDQQGRRQPLRAGGLSRAEVARVRFLFRVHCDET